MHRMNMGGSGEKTKLDKKVIKRIISYMSDYKWQMIMVVVSIIFSAIAGVAGSVFIRSLIDDLITPLIGQTNPVFTELKKALIILACVYGVGIFCGWFYQWVMVDITQSSLDKIRKEMFCKMQHLPIKYFDTHPFGDVMSHYTNDIDTLRELISQGLPQIMATIVTLISVFFAMLFTSPLLTLVVIGGVGLMIFVAKTVMTKSSKYFVGQQKAIGEMNGYIEEMINGQKVIKVFTHEEKAEEAFDVLNENHFGNTYKANFITASFMPIMANLTNLQYVFLALVGGSLAVANIGNITVGVIGSFLLLSKSFSMPIVQVAQQLNHLVMAFAGASRIFKLMDEAPEEDNGYVTLVNAEIVDNQIVATEKRTGLWAWKHPHEDGSVSFTPLRGDVTFENVCFGYNEEKLVLRDITLSAKDGQKIAFVGSTGAGKTTITNLINRFYDINEGKIRYDGINIKKIKKDDLRHSLGIVLQDTHLFSATIMENIRFGRLDATDEEVYSACKLANADDFIRRLPNGYDTFIDGEGAKLSQGQKQLLSIARAAVADAPVMILDEATSSIDTRTETLVQQGMDRLMEGRTVFVIAHRLSTIKNSDIIMVLDGGKIVEQGNHEELMALNGRYSKLYTGSFKKAAETA